MTVPNEDPPIEDPCPEGQVDPHGYKRSVVHHCEHKVIHAADAPPVEIVPIFGLVEVSVNNMMFWDLTNTVVCSGHVQVHGKAARSCIKYKTLD